MIYISPGMESKLGSILSYQDVTSLASRTCEIHRTLDRKLSGDTTESQGQQWGPPNTHSLTVAQMSLRLTGNLFISASPLLGLQMPIYHGFIYKIQYLAEER